MIITKSRKMIFLDIGHGLRNHHQARLIVAHLYFKLRDTGLSHCHIVSSKSVRMQEQFETNQEFKIDKNKICCLCFFFQLLFMKSLKFIVASVMATLVAYSKCNRFDDPVGRVGNSNKM